MYDNENTIEANCDSFLLVVGVSAISFFVQILLVGY